MKGLAQIPGSKQLLTAYNRMQANNPVQEDQLILYAQWTRFDPRLAEIWIQYFEKNWLNLNPLKLYSSNSKADWPQCLAVLLDHILLIKNFKKNIIFQYFYKIAIHQIKPIEYQSYTIALYKFAGKILYEQAQRPHPLFSKWGFYEVSPFFNKNQKPMVSTLMSASERKKNLNALLKTKKKITANDCLSACHNAIHRRQAERDLRTMFKLKSSGNTRGRVYWR